MNAFKNYGQVACQSFPPKSTFSVDDQIPNLTGRVVIVTGGYAGIGKETSKALLDHNAKVYIASRSKTKADVAIQELKKATGHEPLFLQLDLANLASVRQAAEEFLSKETELHILFNNAGVMTPPVKQITSNGYDMQFGTNVIGHWYFAQLLIPALLRGKATSPDHHTRIITTSSSAAYLTPLHWDTFKDGPARVALGAQMLYAQSKLANAIVAREFAKRYGDQGIISISVNPGNIKSELQRNMSSLEYFFINTILLYPTPMGALTQLFAGTMPEALNYNGEFLIPWARVGRLRKEAYDPEVGAKLWSWLEEQVKDL
ncbi:NAD(P)-binding protein [Irpex rosettiformis]|uniref:NAD(P)-binding protein n=1 Tax=Irpex rosettiformis TaxID=378272 RepID=A0ACB8U3F6_9APHY|nr:NAD(P)-binding protein [Irpex rosettiformis]